MPSEPIELSEDNFISFFDYVTSTETSSEIGSWPPWPSNVDKVTSKLCPVGHTSRRYWGCTTENLYVHTCLDCYQKFSKCNGCSSVFTQSSNITEFEFEKYCKRCTERYINYCSICDRTRYGDRYRLPDNGPSCCRDCFNERAVDCYNCGIPYYHENTRVYRHGNYCESCYNEVVPPGPFHATSFKKNPSKRLVGFELEYFALDRPSLYHLGQIHDDGSIECDEDEFIAQEFSSAAANGDSLFDVIDEATTKIKRYNGQVNESCGLHVHLDMNKSSEDQRENIKAWWREFEPVFFAMVSPSRRDNDYTKSVKDYHLDNEDWQNNRYHALNIAAFHKWGTFEVRLHHGTLNPEKIKNWIKILLSFFDHFSTIPLTAYRKTKLKKMSDRKKLIFFCNELKLSLSDKKKVINRIKTYERGSSRKVLNLAKVPN